MIDDAEDRYPIRDVEDSVSGVALIINIFTTKWKAPKNKSLLECIVSKSEDEMTISESNREGSKLDVNSLKSLFKYLNFETMSVSDLTASEIKKRIILFSQDLDSKYKDRDMCAVVVMGHGKDNVIYGADGEMVNIKQDILDKFSNTNCRSMTGKPKLFVFQSCRGDKKDTGIDTGLERIRRISTDGKKINTKEQSVLTDSLEAYSTIDDFVAWRNVDEGSFFIQKICEVFHKKAHQDEIQKLFRGVTREIKRMEVKVGQKEYIPTPPETRARLDKAWYFKPDIGSHYDTRDRDADSD